ncbi:hypothetical protein DTO164E3_7312 [Paecilomyces variotii]|nr:hypothetical protein DTO164E3_7312 [Paecilomyces variotii]KAJ9208182.1 hypothetical protein DTO032I3_853 [Paecilomyces variotii]KAJ9282084.1 hypothetical protein DTO021D3_836 [Paecilomyces variotii]KAJ9299594.1 hypothetical protein DTO217A2_8111 [Paecilomyces variotii]KAJ9343576.1 hypothetical protein DTO027B6_3794 [Paecilomyces variotii]
MSIDPNKEDTMKRVPQSTGRDMKLPVRQKERGSHKESSKKSTHDKGIKDSDIPHETIKQHDEVNELGSFFSELPSSFPWNFEAKWPLTRRERIKELEELSEHYEKTAQKDNIRAARLYHAQFPLDEIVPEKDIFFQDGKQVEESEIKVDAGVIWDEGPPILDDFIFDR